MTSSSRESSPLKFNEKHHEYVLDGKPVPSVTTVISNISEDMMLNSAFQRAGARGTMVHNICDKIKQGKKVNFKAMTDEIAGYVNGYVKFRKERAFTVIASEVRVYSKSYRFAGTIDDLLLDEKSRLGVFDIKTSSIVSPTTMLQTAAYAHCIDEMGTFKEFGKVKQRGCIWLTGDGDYELISYDGKSDLNIFLSHLAVHNWKRKVGLK